MSKSDEAAHKKSSFSNFLVESGYRPLVFLGKAVLQFGWPVVVAFVLGGVGLYVVGIFFPLPYLSAPVSAPATEQNVLLEGEVLTIDGEPFTDFRLGIVRGQLYGPFATEDGKFEISAPFSEEYNLIVFPNEGLHPIAYYGNNRTLKESPEKLVLKHPLRNFPTQLARAEGKVIDIGQKPVTGSIEINGHMATIDQEGNFHLENIPLGAAKLRILSPEGAVLKEQLVNLEVMQTTPLVIIIGEGNP